MKVTNDYHLPDPVYKAICNDDYDNGGADLSVTTLISPMRIAVLTKKHDEEITRDASSMVASLMGKAVHTILENNTARGISEKRLFSAFNGTVISGQVDNLEIEGGILRDWKTLSDKAFMRKSREGYKEWEVQTNIYRYLWMQNHPQLPINYIEVTAIILGYSQSEKKFKLNYPSKPVETVPINVWDLSVTENYILSRIEEYEKALKVLPLCTDEERWKDPDDYAVMKKGNTRASKVFQQEDEAEEYIHTQKKPELFHVEFRKKLPRRCEDWCDAANFCTQWRDEQLEISSGQETEPLDFL